MLLTQGKALHGEQYLEVKAPLPPAATVVTTAQVVDVQDKGKGAVVVSECRRPTAQRMVMWLLVLAGAEGPPAQTWSLA